MAGASEQLDLSDQQRLVGAAVALGAGSVGTLSAAELRLTAGAPRPARDQLRALRESILDGLDPLGDAFCVLRSPASRRSDGATYTPSPIVRAMTDWAADGPSPDHIVDPGSGSGRFAIAAALRFPNASVTAVESDPVAAL